MTAHQAFCEQAGIALPIVQAPMGGAACPALAAAVSNAGGLGMLALSWHPVEALRGEIRAACALTVARRMHGGIHVVAGGPSAARRIFRQVLSV